MTVIVNQSQYPAQGVERRFWHGNPYHCLSVKVTLAWDDEGRLRHPAQQQKFEIDERWFKRPMRSSLTNPGDLIPYKPNTDVLVQGVARPPEGEPVASWAGSLTIDGPRIQRLEKRLQFVGPRVWRHSLLGGWQLSKPEPCSGVALLYENAYGGTVDPEQETFKKGYYYPDNPFGRGFVGRGRVDKSIEHPAAQIEAWGGAITRFGHDVPVGGLGPVPGFFPSRYQYRGTWDENSESAPDAGMPLDMDMRYWNSAPPDQQSEGYLRAGDTVTLMGLRAGPPVQLIMPGMTALATAHFENARSQASTMNLDTVMIDLNRREMSLRYHRIIAVDSRISRISLLCGPHSSLSGERGHG